MILEELIDSLRKEQIETWFDLGLFIDRFREEQDLPSFWIEGSYDDFKEHLRKGGIAFITFHYMVDGVTNEVKKYASLVRRNIPGIPVYYIAGEIQSKAAQIFNEDYDQFVIPEMKGFNNWELYRDFFFTRLERGSEKYNQLILELWEQTLTIVEELGRYIEENRINLLYVINICSNPGNVALALATVLISEFMSIPVINNNHDFYWEGGMCKAERENSNSKPGPRDFFFTNGHLGEIFSVIEVLFPWQSRTWLNVNINRRQSEYIIRNKGHNPANVMEIGTAVDTTLYTKNDKRKNINTFIQIEKILSRYGEKLVSYSVEDVLDRDLVAENNPKPILIGCRTGSVDRFISENILLLQPTRIITRKRIEKSFNLLLKIFEEEEMLLRFRKTPHMKITLLITGPIATGHFNYYRKLVEHFRELLNQVLKELKNRVYLGLFFGELDKDSFKERFDQPVGISEMYNIASLVLLPSKTEGRGLPIIEATACGTPIFCRRYEPETVYSEVIGEHLEERNRLKVLEFKGKKISKGIVKQIISRMFFPNNYTEEFRHNRRVVHRRYSLDALNENIYQILRRIYFQLKNNERNYTITSEIIDDYREMVSFRNDDLKELLDTRNRHYLPGYGRLSFMIMLKSLIDPSSFRVEQQIFRGMVFHFAREIIRNDPDTEFLPDEKVNSFYNTVETLFVIREGETIIQHDHSMSYRHRNQNHYLYQDFTFQELTGIINLLYIRIIQPTPVNRVDMSTQFFTDWNLALLQLTGSSYLAIDNRIKLIERLQTNLPIAYFPGVYIMYELEFFALQSIRSRLSLPIEQMLTREILNKKAGELQPVYIFAQEKKLGKQLNKDEITDYILNGESEELKLLYEFKIIQIIRTRQVCVGIHFPQLGRKALKVLKKIKERNGYILTNRSNAAMMTDMVDMDRFHIGKVANQFTANIMGIDVNSGYIQYVPAGIRTTLSYPTPIQTAKDFDNALESDLFKFLVSKHGELKVMNTIKEDAAERGSPVMHVLQSMNQDQEKLSGIDYTYISGLHSDKMPYNGVLAQINFKTHRWDFAAVSTPDTPRTVLQFVDSFWKKTGKKARIAWNGGYILNPELVGKLGLPEAYIGSPLGMIISEGTMISPPLFNKPAMLVYKEGTIDIKRVNCSGGIKLTWESYNLEFTGNHYNNLNAGDDLAYYDLLYPGDEIEGNGRIFIRLAGNVVKEIIKSGPKEKISMVPVGLTLAVNPSLLPPGLKPGEQMILSIPEYKDVVHAVEAGPMLLNRGEECIHMEAEGWKTSHSIRTQAARLDYTNMRGPKIAVGINARGEMAVLTINGRIRESVGATHADMAVILKKHGMECAMGFDPGGSSTLVVGERTLNISPYNSKYESNRFALPPEPRAVSNAVLGFLKE